MSPPIFESRLGLAKVGFGAVAMVALTATEQIVSPGGGPLTFAAGSTTLGWLAGQSGSISSLSASHIGNAANVGGQTITYNLYKNGVLVGSSNAMATTAGTKTDTKALASRVYYVAGDVFKLTMLPSALLTAIVTDIMLASG